MRTRELLALHFNLTVPTTLALLKAAYRAKCVQLHPDRSGYDSTKDFQAMQAAYTSLIKQPDLFTDDVENLADCTTDGTPLSELGLGLGPNINSRNCLECDSKGYTVEPSQGMGPCTRCDQLGYIPALQPCDPCKGTGRFKLRSGRMVECRECHGTGTRTLHRSRRSNPYMWVPDGFIICPSCDSRGWVWITAKYLYRRCLTCKGAGQERIWNPVIPKGRLR